MFRTIIGGVARTAKAVVGLPVALFTFISAVGYWAFAPIYQRINADWGEQSRENSRKSWAWTKRLATGDYSIM